MIGVISEQRNDITSILERNKIKYELLNPSNFGELQEYSSLMILGGTKNSPLILNIKQRKFVEDFIGSGKKVFTEFVGGIGAVSVEEVILSRFERLAYIEDMKIPQLEVYDILDNQCTYRIKPFHDVLKTRKPIIVFTKEHVHSQIEPISTELEVGSYAVFFESENVLYSSAQWANFNQNRYTPRPKVQSFVKWMIEWVCDQAVSLNFLEPSYTFDESDREVKSSVDQVFEWFKSSETLLDNGNSGVSEGFSTEINLDGEQLRACNVRGDCVGESALFFYIYGKAYKNQESLQIADNLLQFLNEYFIIHEGELEGFVRWSAASYQSSYGDDAARMLLGPLFKNLLGDGTKVEYEDIIKVCNHIVKTSGSDGTRPSRLEIEELTNDKMYEISASVDNSRSAHYSGYTYASLLLAHLLCGDESYLRTGQMGIDQLMSHYPNTAREQSQTQEEARLIFPLSIIYFITQEEKYKVHLKQVCDDMNLRHHESGCYLEWDEGYQAHMRNTDGDGECSLLSHNGDSVVDLLYTNNWLPLGFAMAYIATNETYYLDKFNEISKFLMNIQMQSKQIHLNGAWARGYDPNYKEYFGSPADMGWGPYCIESGWTVAEIGAGMIIGQESALIRKALIERRSNL